MNLTAVHDYKGCFRYVALLGWYKLSELIAMLVFFDLSAT